MSRAHAELAGYALLHYVLGHTVDEQSRLQLAELGALTRKPVSPDVSTETAAGPDVDLLDGDPSVRFDFGLTLFVDGIRSRLREGDPAASRPNVTPVQPT
ncbi:Predicted biotin repressor from TetR family [Rhodococcus aetherivorans]|nr:Predicted biotin repressor from TetR family [Rhodococcus aetherivorans]